MPVFSDGSNQHEPTELTIVTLDSTESKNIIEPIATDLTITIGNLK